MTISQCFCFISCYKRKYIITKKGFPINSVFSIGTANKEIIREIKQIIKGKLFIKSNGKNAKIIYNAQIQYMETIKDYLILKKRQAELMIEYCKSRQKNKGKECSQTEIEIAETITKLNKRGVK